ncbi:probable transmembrane reductase CYB561D1 isoform X2 [Mustela nigripes]|nr:probable transmembrane reductase CYB561D1 isoform X2 [Mustela nigripes]
MLRERSWECSETRSEDPRSGGASCGGVVRAWWGRPREVGPGRVGLWARGSEGRHTQLNSPVQQKRSPSWRMQVKEAKVHPRTGLTAASCRAAELPDGESRPDWCLFSWHPVFMALAFCLCMAEAILLFSPEHSLFFFCSRKARIRLHWAGQTLAILCAALGLGFIIFSRTRSELPHLVSWHSWVGALTLLATSGQALCGFCLLCPRAARVSRVARLKLYHLTCGLVVYLLATVTVLLGMYSVWFQAQIKGTAWYLCLALPLYPALVIMHQISSSYLPKKKMEM